MGIKAALIGYGKMGREIEKQSPEHGIEVVCIIDNDSDWQLKMESLKTADVAIEFSRPDAVIGNIEKCLKAGVPIVVGTTAWYQHLEHVKNLVVAHDGTLLFATNFSLGMNLFFELNRQLAGMIQKIEGYRPELEEIHHTSKLDAPSGTAISLAEGLMGQFQDMKRWINQTSDKPDELGIVSKRIANEPGTHIVRYTSEIDRIEIKHTAFTRAGFTQGALLAARWIVGKKGVYTMKDVLNF